MSDVLGTAIIDLKADANNLRIGLDRSRAQIEQLVHWVEGRKQATVKVGVETDTSGFSKVIDATQRAVNAVKSYGVQMQQTGLAMTSLGVLMAAPFVKGIKTAIDFEDAWKGASKTLADQADKIEGGLGGMRKEVEDLSRKLPQGFVELSKIMEVSGQLGVDGKANLINFTEEVAKISTISGMTSETVATKMAQIAASYNITGDAFMPFAQKLGDAFVYVGQKTTATEEMILHFANRISGAGKIVGMSAPDIVGIGAAFASVGIQAEAGGTAVQKVMINIAAAVNTNSEDAKANLELFAKTSGMSADQFKKMWQEDAAGAFTKFVEGLGKTGTQAFTVMKDLEEADARTMRAFLQTAGAGELLAKSIKMANDAAEKGGAVNEIFAARVDSAKARLAIFKNNFDLLAAAIGDALIPVLTEVVNQLEPMVKKFEAWVKENPEAIKQIAKMVLGFVALGATFTIVGTGLRMIGGLFGMVLGPVKLLYLLFKANWTKEFIVNTMISGNAVGRMAAMIVTAGQTIAAAFAGMTLLSAGIAAAFVIAAGIVIYWVNEHRKAFNQLEESQDKLLKKQKEYDDLQVKSGNVTKKEIEDIQKVRDDDGSHALKWLAQMGYITKEQEQNYRRIAEANKQNYLVVAAQRDIDAFLMADAAKKEGEILAQQESRNALYSKKQMERWQAEEKGIKQAAQSYRDTANEVADSLYKRKATEEEVSEVIRIAREKEMTAEQASYAVIAGGIEKKNGLLISHAAITRTINEAYLEQKQFIEEADRYAVQKKIENLTNETLTIQESDAVRSYAIKNMLDLETAYYARKYQFSQDEINWLRAQTVEYTGYSANRTAILNQMDATDAQHLANRVKMEQDIDAQSKMYHETNMLRLQQELNALGLKTTTQEQAAEIQRVALEYGISMQLAHTAVVTGATEQEINAMRMGADETEIASARKKAILQDEANAAAAAAEQMKTTSAQVTTYVNQQLDLLAAQRQKIMNELKTLDENDTQNRIRLTNELKSNNDQRMQITEMGKRAVLMAKEQEAAAHFKAAGIEAETSASIIKGEREVLAAREDAIARGHDIVIDAVSQNSELKATYEGLEEKQKDTLMAMVGNAAEWIDSEKELKQLVTDALKTITEKHKDAAEEIKKAGEQAREGIFDFSPTTEHSPSPLSETERGVEGIINAYRALPPEINAVGNEAMNALGGMAYATIATSVETQDAIQVMVNYWWWYVGELWAAANEAYQAMQYLDPNQRHSPSIVDRVESGLDDVVSAYADGANKITKTMEVMAELNTRYTQKSFKTMTTDATKAAKTINNTMADITGTKVMPGSGKAAGRTGAASKRTTGEGSSSIIGVLLAKLKDSGIIGKSDNAPKVLETFFRENQTVMDTLGDTVGDMIVVLKNTGASKPLGANTLPFQQNPILPRSRTASAGASNTPVSALMGALTTGPMKEISDALAEISRIEKAGGASNIKEAVLVSQQDMLMKQADIFKGLQDYLKTVFDNGGTFQEVMSAIGNALTDKVAVETAARFAALETKTSSVPENAMLKYAGSVIPKDVESLVSNLSSAVNTAPDATGLSSSVRKVAVTQGQKLADALMTGVGTKIKSAGITASGGTSGPRLGTSTGGGSGGGSVDPEKDSRVIELRKKIADAKKKIEADLYQNYVAQDRIQAPTDSMRAVNQRNIQSQMDAMMKNFKAAGKVDENGMLINNKLTNDDKEKLRALSEKAFMDITGLSAADARRNATAQKGEVLFENYSTQVDKQNDTIAALTKQLEELIKSIREGGTKPPTTGGGTPPPSGGGRPSGGGVPPPGTGSGGPSMPPSGTGSGGGGGFGGGCIDLCTPPGALEGPGGDRNFDFNFSPVIQSIRTDDDIKNLATSAIQNAQRFSQRC